MGKVMLEPDPNDSGSSLPPLPWKASHCNVAQSTPRCI